MQVGDIVRLKSEARHLGNDCDGSTDEGFTYFDPIAMVTGRFNALMVYVHWGYSGRTERVNSEYFEVVSAAG